MKEVCIPVIEGYKKKYYIPSLYIRPFGSRIEDLDMSFSSPAGPYLITGLLQSCVYDPGGASIPVDFFWDIPVGSRIEILLRIVFLSCPGSIWAVLYCQNRECGEKMEIEIEEDDLQEDCKAYEQEKIEIKTHDAVLYLQRPRGIHQLQWLHRTYENEAAAVADMIRAVIINENDDLKKEPFPEKIVQLIMKTMQTYDPFSAFRMSIICPYCGEMAEYSIDIQTLALKKLAVFQRNLIYEIHLLARHYHWNEKEIISLPAWRRRKYIELIEGRDDDYYFYSI